MTQETTVETILVVPSHKVGRMRKMLRGADHQSLVISPGSYIGAHRPRFIMLDTDLKDDWDFRMDQWFHEILMLRVHPNLTEGVGWVKEKDTDAEA